MYCWWQRPDQSNRGACMGSQKRAVDLSQLSEEFLRRIADDGFAAGLIGSHTMHSRSLTCAAGVISLTGGCRGTPSPSDGSILAPSSLMARLARAHREMPALIDVRGSMHGRGGARRERSGVTDHLRREPVRGG